MSDKTPLLNDDASVESGDAHSNAGQKLWFTVKAIEIRLRFIAVLVGIGLVIGYWDWIQNHWDKWTRSGPTEVRHIRGRRRILSSDASECRP